MKQLTIALAFALALGPLGCDKGKADAPATTTAEARGDGPAGEKRVLIEANDKGFSPSSINVTKGEKTTLVFKRTSDQTCATEVVFPDLKLEKKLPLNEAVAFEVPTDQSRTLAFQCGMGMYKSKIVVQ